MKNIILVIISLININLLSQNNYKYSNLPDELKKNANYIIWEDFMEFEVLDAVGELAGFFNR